MSKTFYEAQKTIFDRMMSRNNLTTQEGSLNYVLNVPFSFELENIRSDMDEIVKINNIIDAHDNGYEEEVEKYCSEDGVERKQAKYSTGKITFYGTQGTQIKAGYQFGDADNGLRYKTTQDAVIGADGSVEVNAISVEAGARYNKDIDTLQYIPIKLVGINSCTNKAPFVGGADLETIDDLFYRHQLKKKRNPNGSNVAQYEEWALEVDNVGYSKCIPAEELGVGGKVKIIIANSNKRKADGDLIQKTYEHIDSVRPVLSGTLEIVSVKEVPLNITGKVEIDNSATIEDIKSNFKKLIEEYLSDKVYKTKKISIAKIQAMLIDIEGVTDCSEIKINNNVNNITLATDEIAVLQNIDLEVI